MNNNQKKAIILFDEYEKNNDKETNHVDSDFSKFQIDLEKIDGYNELKSTVILGVLGNKKPSFAESRILESKEKG